ncbi:hypothetical protein NC652_015158 [Populus alba x Populus x berolinensis]|nr:hypothetical protein NC652_015158 [Populus alba x Populus x berolinensis]
MATAASASLSLSLQNPKSPANDMKINVVCSYPNSLAETLALLSFLALVPSAPASAFSVGISDSQSEFKEEKLEEVQRLLKSAARDCVPQDRNSFVAFQANTGVEVCTFRLIVKNAASLLDKKDPAKLEAEAILDDLIRSFTSLDGLANEANVQLASDRQKVADALMNTISSLDKFEQGGSLLEPSPNTSSSKSIGSCISAIWLLMALPLKRVPVISMLMKRNSSTRNLDLPASCRAASFCSSALENSTPLN